MQHSFDFQRLVIATHNPGKLHEFAELLAPYIPAIMSAGDLHLPEPEETGATFAANAVLKAKSAARVSESVALADDSGLCVVGLDNRPGIYSARWGGPDKNMALAMQRVHKELGNAADRSAYFICTLALAWPDGHTETVEGRIDGHIVWPPRGDQGHGYDPIFVARGHDRTFAEMGAAEKHAVSHRGIATHKLIALLRQRAST